MSLTALELYPIGTVLSITMPKWFIFGTQQVVGIVTGMTIYPGIDSYIALSCRSPKGRRIKRLYRPGLLDALRQEQMARILWMPPYARNLRKTGDENPLISFPKGSRVCFNKHHWGEVFDGAAPNAFCGNHWGVIIIRPLNFSGNDPMMIGTEQITKYFLPSWSKKSFAELPFPDLEEFLPTVFEQDTVEPEGLALP